MIPHAPLQLDRHVHHRLLSLVLLKAAQRVPLDKKTVRRARPVRQLQNLRIGRQRPVEANPAAQRQSTVKEARYGNEVELEGAVKVERPSPSPPRKSMYLYGWMSE